MNAGCKGSWRVSFSLPSRAVFDLLEQGGATLRRQAEARLGAGRRDEETAGLMKSQAELVERTIGTLRQPAAIAKVEMTLDRGPRAQQPQILPLTTGIADGVPRAGAATSTPRPATDAEIISTVGSRLRARARPSRCRY